MSFTQKDALLCIKEGWVIPAYAAMLVENLVDLGMAKEVYSLKLTEKGEEQLNKLLDRN